MIQPVVPVLPLRPLRRRPIFKQAEDFFAVENDNEHASSERLPSGGWRTPSNGLSIQFGELGGDRPAASFNKTGSLVEVALSPMPSGMSAPRHVGILSSQKLLPDTSNNDSLTQAASSQPGSIPPTLKFPSNNPTPKLPETLQTSVVELPAEARTSYSSLNISFLCQEDIDTPSTTSTVSSGSPTLEALPKMSEPSGTSSQSC